MSVTIRKIATDLKLAVSTVSKALRDSHEISVETKKRVFAYAEEMDYIPNLYASSLKRKKTGNIAVVLPEVADSFFSLAINGIESVAQEKGYHVMVYLTHENLSKEESILRDFRSGRVDGVLISVSGGAESNSHIHELCSKNIPLVFFDRACESIQAAKVLTDDFEAGYKATEHLIKKGCQQIAFLAMSETLAIINHRQQGYEEALRHHNMPVNKNFVIVCNNNEQDSYAIIRNKLTSKSKPDGIVGSVEKLTTLTYTVCQDLKINIPDELKVIAFSSLQIASLLNPSLSTITQPAFEMGRSAAAFLFRSLENRNPRATCETLVIPSVLFERGSTR
ncbi:MAG: LacI family transcriptional regulator [Marivirga sp.]|nr:LacI family transcriptional regulator [Marivirga sp.]